MLNKQKMRTQFGDKINLETVTYLEIRSSDFDETFRMSSPQYGLSKSENRLTKKIQFFLRNYFLLKQANYF